MVRAAYGPMGAGARHLSFFSELKKSFQKEVEQNKEFRESLNKLKVLSRTRLWLRSLEATMPDACNWMVCVVGGPAEGYGSADREGAGGVIQDQRGG